MVARRSGRGMGKGKQVNGQGDEAIIYMRVTLGNSFGTRDNGSMDILLFCFALEKGKVKAASWATGEDHGLPSRIRYLHPNT